MKALNPPTGVTNQVKQWALDVSSQLQDLSARVNQIDGEKGQRVADPSFGGAAYMGIAWPMAAAVTLPASSTKRAHYINCTTSANLTLPTARRADWVLLSNVNGSRTITVLNQSASTLGTLAPNEMALYYVKSNSSNVLDWQVQPIKWNVTTGAVTVSGLTNSALTAGRVVFAGTAGVLSDDANFTYNSTTDQLALAASGSGAGLLIGGDVQIYRSAADNCLIPDKLQVAPPTNTATSGSVFGLLLSHTANPASASSGRTFGLSFTATASGNQNYTDATGGITGIEAGLSHTGSGTITNGLGCIVSGSSSSTGVITQFTHFYALGWDASSGATVTTWNGFRSDFPRLSGAGTVVTAYGFVTNPRTVSTGVITNMIGYGVFPSGNMNAHNANNQIRLGIDIGAMPSPGAFTGTTTAAIRIQGTGGQRDGILFSNFYLYYLASGVLGCSGGIKSIHDTNGVGYGTGAGGTVTQATSKATGVTLNKVCGQITLNNAALNAATSVSFTLTNSAIAATDTVLVNIQSAATADSYSVTVTAVAAGSCRIQIHNFSASNLSEALVLNFSVIKAVTS